MNVCFGTGGTALTELMDMAVGDATGTGGGGIGVVDLVCTACPGTNGLTRDIDGNRGAGDAVAGGAVMFGEAEGTGGDGEIIVRG